MPREGHPQERFLHSIDDIFWYTSTVFDEFAKDFSSICIINGNHDDSLGRRTYGFDLAYNLSREFSNVRYSKEPDQPVAIYEIPGNLHAVLYHGTGGCAQNLTTRTRNVSNKICGYTQDWDLLLAGHCHGRSSDYYLGRYAYSPGCFQSMTPFLASKMLTPIVEGLILTYGVDDGRRIAAVKPETPPYSLKTLKWDYPARFK